ncbi:septum-promoting GTP-binding protein 1-like isoform X1 [Carex littledalei]|uniref:Septum-promoting GTP-binding protein 1-like isoform X1 n=1 Tax=Carex littledalei TaxID=544730 RepID=A0A833VP64_9POAL|nr:septum-promoting GTP-binding protein 1-like isoform X1 [Carex littledalei]
MKHQLIDREYSLRIQLLRWARHVSLSIYKRFFRVLWSRICPCSCGARYRRLLVEVSEPRAAGILSANLHADINALPGCMHTDASSDEMVSLKVSLLGDCHVGKTSFMIKYVGEEEEKKGMEMSGLNLMDKVLMVRGATIALTIWDVAGDKDCVDHVPLACKDAVAILYMFDLTSRCTLSNVKDWYIRARKWNKTAIPILIGLKFDDFSQLPLDMQWTITTEARTYARAMKAALFFSSATHNINVNKIFKFIMARCFNLPSTIKRNLNVGEPIIDF